MMRHVKTMQYRRQMQFQSSVVYPSLLWVLKWKKRKKSDQRILNLRHYSQIKMHPWVLSDPCFINGSPSLFGLPPRHTPSRPSSFVKTRPALGVRRRETLFFFNRGNTLSNPPWPAVIHASSHAHTHTQTQTQIHARCSALISHTLRQTEKTNIKKNERFRRRGGQEAGGSPSEWQTALSDRGFWRL